MQSQGKETYLAEAAMRLRASDPTGWDLFVKAVRNYQAEAVANLMNADVTMLQRAQGISIGVSDLYNAMLKAPDVYEKARDFQRQKGTI